MTPERLRDLLTELARGRLDVDQAEQALTHLTFEDLGFARVDHHRALRQGTPEVIYGAGKTPEQIASIARALLERGADVLCTRVDRAAYEALRAVAPEARFHDTARCATVQRHARRTSGRVAVVCAGTSDLPVAEEAACTAEFHGLEVQRLADVGVAGIHRLFAALDTLRACDVIIVVAGMEGALPSVVGGLVAVPVIAVPTSVGYGASFRGVAALLGMLNSCAAGVTVVNIDNGFGAAAAAFRILGARR